MPSTKMNNSKKSANNAMNLLALQPGFAPTVGSPSTKGTRSSKYQQLSVQLERLKFENRTLKSRIGHLETIFDKKRGKTEMDKNINLLSSLLHQIKLAKRESGINKKLGKNKLKDEVNRLYNLLKQAKDDCLSKMDQLVQADLRLEKERKRRNMLLDELTNDRKTFVAVLRADRKRYVTTLKRVQDGGEQVIINEKLIFGDGSLEQMFNGKKERNRRNYNRNSHERNRRPKSSGRARRGKGSRHQDTSDTRMRKKKYPARPHTAGKLHIRSRPPSSGKPYRPKSGPSVRAVTHLQDSNVIQPINKNTNFDNNIKNNNHNNQSAEDTDTGDTTSMNSRTQNNIVQSYKVPESPSNQVVEEIVASSGEMSFLSDLKPPKRPVRVGPKERAGGIRRRVISGPNKLIEKKSDEDISTYISPEKQLAIEQDSTREIQSEMPIENNDNDEDEEDADSINTEYTDGLNAVKMPIFGGNESNTSSSGGEEEDDEEEEEEEEEESEDEESVDSDEEGSLESNKLIVLDKKSDGETRVALPPLNTTIANNRPPQTRDNEKMDKINDSKNDPPKIFPLTP
jgi:hypothetical protein